MAIDRSRLITTILLVVVVVLIGQVYWQNRRWRISMNIRNVLDTNYFNPNSTGAALVHKGLPRNFEFSVTRRL